MKWNVIQLQKFRDKAMTIDEHVDVEKDLMQKNPEIRGVSPIHVTGNADIDSRKITFHLRLTGEFVLPCSRTLVDVKYPFNIRSTETFLLMPLDDELADLEETHDIPGGVVDLMPIIQELLFLELPMQVFCDGALDNMAVSSGSGWEVKTEEQLKQEQQQKEKKVDPRLADLAQFFESKKE